MSPNKSNRQMTTVAKVNRIFEIKRRQLRRRFFLLILLLSLSVGFCFAALSAHGIDKNISIIYNDKAIGGDYDTGKRKSVYANAV